MPPTDHAPLALYAAFDRFPSTKGAAVHIDRFARTLFDTLGGGQLCVLGDDELAPLQREEHVTIRRFAVREPNLLRRAMAYGRWLEGVVRTQGEALRIAHFRDPWSGVPILRSLPPSCATVYEVNGLPSVELPAAFGELSPQTLEKLRRTEQFCLEAADHIVTPSHTIAGNLIERGVDGQNITVIPNGADPLERSALPPGAPRRYLLYFGAVQPWQGVDTLLRAFARLLDLPDLSLVICASVAPSRTKGYRKLARGLGLGDRVLWHHGLSQGELAPWRDNALVSLAPLSDCDRNLAQGCSPLKVLESMAAGVAVIASDLPPVRELVEDGVHGRLVPPDRPAELARAIRILLEYPELREQMGRAARLRVIGNFTWEHATGQLKDLYRELLLQTYPDSPKQ